MPLYKVTAKEDGKVTLVEAPSQPAALGHMAASLFDAERIGNPVEVGRLMASGVKMVTAGDPVADSPKGEGAGDGEGDPPSGDSEPPASDGASEQNSAAPAPRRGGKGD